MTVTRNPLAPRDVRNRWRCKCPYCSTILAPHITVRLIPAARMVYCDERCAIAHGKELKAARRRS